MTAPIARAPSGCDHSELVWCANCIPSAHITPMRSVGSAPHSTQCEPMADWLSQSELEDIERRARFDGGMIGFGLGICIGTAIAFVVFWWLA
jgi:hypothetical protein